VKINDPNITMEAYIRLEEEKARRCAIVFNDALTSEVALSCEPTISPLNDAKIDFRTSFDESDDEDYTVIYDENSFSYKIIYVNNLKTDSKNDNDKVNMPSFPSPEPEVSYSNDLDFFEDFENEFPAIIYNDALTSKLDFLTKLTISTQHINEFNLKDETSLSKCNEEEQNVLYFNDLFPFNVIYPDDLKLDMDNGNDEINIEQPSGRVNKWISELVRNFCISRNSNSTHDLIVKEKMDHNQKLPKRLSALKTSSISKSWRVLTMERGLFGRWGDAEQYLTFTDHALWEVIVNGDSVIPVASTSDGAEGPIPPKTIEQKLARKNELKAKKHSYASHS
ncbi:hypothetical protein Tco_0611085, partial [Tanacetum coccineum]